MISVGTGAAHGALRRRFGEASRQIAVAEFSVDRIGQEIVALYDELLSLGAKPLHSSQLGA